MSDDDCRIGCTQPGPHGLMSEQVAEGRRREFLGGEVELTTTHGEKFTVEVADPLWAPGVTWDEEHVTDLSDLAPLATLEELTEIPNGIQGPIWLGPNWMQLADRLDNPTFQDTFHEIFDEAFDLLVERQRKYGPENVRKLGLYGIFTRIEDKMERIRFAFHGQMRNGVLDIAEVNPTADETLDEADLDAANYHLIRIALRRGVWGRPLADDE